MESHSKVNACSACLHHPDSVPYIVHESAQARLERITHRLWVSTIILIVLLIGTNFAWLWYESQFETVMISQDITNDDGDILYRNNLLGVGDMYGQQDNDNGIDPAA